MANSQNQSYADFLSSKAISIAPSGFTPADLHADLFAFQSDIVRWSLERGRAAYFQDCGTGKTFQQLVWAEQVTSELNKPVLILAPLAVSKQIEREGKKFGIKVTVAASDMDVKKAGVYVTNYEKLQHFDPSRFGGIVLDESSILKSFTGATRNLLIDRFRDTPMKLCCTATPAPNDFMELGNHSEFLGVLTRTEMLSTFFVHDGGDTAKWRLKGHAAVDRGTQNTRIIPKPATATRGTERLNVGGMVDRRALVRRWASRRVGPVLHFVCAR